MSRWTQGALLKGPRGVWGQKFSDHTSFSPLTDHASFIPPMLIIRRFAPPTVLTYIVCIKGRLGLVAGGAGGGSLPTQA